MYFLLKMGIFQCYVSFQGCNKSKRNLIYQALLQMSPFGLGFSKHHPEKKRLHWEGHPHALFFSNPESGSRKPASLKKKWMERVKQTSFWSNDFHVHESQSSFHGWKWWFPCIFKVTISFIIQLKQPFTNRYFRFHIYVGIYRRFEKFCRSFQLHRQEMGTWTANLFQSILATWRTPKELKTYKS